MRAVGKEGVTAKSIGVSFDIDSDTTRDFLACARAGAEAWARLPALGILDAAMRPNDVGAVVAIVDELEQRVRDARAEREAGYRRATKERKREAKRSTETDERPASQ